MYNRINLIIPLLLALVLALTATPAKAGDTGPINVELIFKNATSQNAVASANLADSSRNWQVSIDPNGSNRIKFTINAPLYGDGDYELYIATSKSGQPYKDCYLDFDTQGQLAKVKIIHAELTDCPLKEQTVIEVGENSLMATFIIGK